MFATTFAPFSAGTVQRVRDIGQVLLHSNASVTPEPVVDASFGLLWPNEMTTAPLGSGPSRFVLGDGFLLPGQETGSVVEVELGGKARRLGTPETDWFYHKAFYIDVNQDGLLDIITGKKFCLS